MKGKDFSQLRDAFAKQRSNYQEEMDKLRNNYVQGREEFAISYVASNPKIIENLVRNDPELTNSLKVINHMHSKNYQTEREKKPEPLRKSDDQQYKDAEKKVLCFLYEFAHRRLQGRALPEDYDEFDMLPELLEGKLPAREVGERTYTISKAAKNWKKKMQDRGLKTQKDLSLKRVITNLTYKKHVKKYGSEELFLPSTRLGNERWKRVDADVFDRFSDSYVLVRRGRIKGRYSLVDVSTVGAKVSDITKMLEGKDEVTNKKAAKILGLKVTTIENYKSKGMLKPGSERGTVRTGSIIGYLRKSGQLDDREFMLHKLAVDARGIVHSRESDALEANGGYK